MLNVNNVKVLYVLIYIKQMCKSRLLSRGIGVLYFGGLLLQFIFISHTVIIY